MRWRTQRDEMFRSHPQSPVSAEARDAFGSVPYFDYNPELRIEAGVEPTQPETYDVPTSGEGPMRFTRFGTCTFALHDQPQTLSVFWLDAYGGGLFLPFRDATSGKTTYGAGRYLYDTVKGADLGTDGNRLILDFNFAYNPSCAYDPRWVCPLAPPDNRLTIPIEAGERI
jgi:uncharacterized protein (DUF1684 family)